MDYTDQSISLKRRYDAIHAELNELLDNRDSIEAKEFHEKFAQAMEVLHKLCREENELKIAHLRKYR